jgi:hypothetical protein
MAMSTVLSTGRSRGDPVNTIAMDETKIGQALDNCAFPHCYKDLMIKNVDALNGSIWMSLVLCIEVNFAGKAACESTFSQQRLCITGIRCKSW